MNLWIYVVAAIILIFFAGVRIVRPTERGLVERLGKYHRFANPGFPLGDTRYRKNVPGERYRMYG